jgi:molybdate transport system substrate-binding protein
MKIKQFLLSLGCLLLFTVSAQAENIHLSAAASMTNALNDLIAGFAVAHPGITVQPNYGSSGSLAKQIEQGAPADVYVSANPKWMQYLMEKQLIATGTDKVFAYNTLVFVSTSGVAVRDMAGLPRLARIALGTPASVPAGQYARQAMEKSGVYAALAKAEKLIMAKDVRQALLYADQGEVDGAFVYKTDALLATSAKIVFTVPQNLYDKIAYPIGLTTEGAKKEAARSFYAYLNNPAAMATLVKFGFEPVK